MRWPPSDCILLRKPCTLWRRRLLGWNVRFTGSTPSPGTIGRRGRQDRIAPWMHSIVRPGKPPCQEKGRPRGPRRLPPTSSPAGARRWRKTGGVRAERWKGALRRPRETGAGGGSGCVWQSNIFSLVRKEARSGAEKRGSSTLRGPPQQPVGKGHKRAPICPRAALGSFHYPHPVHKPVDYPVCSLYHPHSLDSADYVASATSRTPQPSSLPHAYPGPRCLGPSDPHLFRSIDRGVLGDRRGDEAVGRDAGSRGRSGAATKL